MPRLPSILAATLFFWGPIRAAECTTADLLAGAKPSFSYDAWDTGRITDGTAAIEGDAWMSDVAAPLSPVGAVVYRLDATARVAAIAIQADGDDEYVVAGSLDGREWRTIWKVPPAGAPGMRFRYETGLDAEVRYLRVRVAHGDAASSIGELAAYCTPPEPWPPAFPARRGIVRDAAWQQERDASIAWAKLALAIAGGAVLLWFPRRYALIAMIAAGAFAWTSFGTFHGSGAIHNPEMFHYVLGSKYFAELRYTELYRCTELAEIDMGRKPFVERRVMRDLATNRLGPATEILANEAPCRTAFTADRWKEFQRDVELYRSSMYPGSWGALFLDHGYNPSPVWTMAGSGITNTDDLARKPGLLALIDALFYAGMLALVLWAFGLQACAAAAWVWGVGYPWDYGWTGGAFARADWLFLAVASLCLLKKGWSGSAGFALGWSALLRVFPAAFAGGAAVLVVRDLVTTRRVDPARLRFVLGGLLALAVLVPLSCLPPNGIAAWKEFVENSATDAKSASANYMGLPAALSYHPDRTQASILTGKIEDYETWDTARRDTLAGRRLWWDAAAAVLLLLFTKFVARHAKEDWEAMAASALVPIVLFQLSCYYYAFLILLVPLALARSRRIAVLAGALACTQLVALSGVATETRFLLESLVAIALATYLVADATLTEHA